MRRNHNFIPHTFEEHLSPFGRKVLKVLIKQWCTDRESTRSEHQKSNRNWAQNRVLSFEEPHIHPIHVHLSPKVNQPTSSNVPIGNTFTPIVYEQESLDQDARKRFYFRDDILQPPLIQTQPSIPTYVELVKPVDMKDIVHVPSNVDLIKLAMINNNDIIHDNVLKTNRDDRNNVLDIDTIMLNPDMSQMKNINWDDMFDTELLSDTPTANIHQEKQTKHDKIFHINKYTNIPEIETNKTTKTDGALKNIDNDSKKIVKRKSQSKITDTVPKKAKKSQMECSKKLKDSLRKEKYTKTVKNWLNNVVSNNDLHKDDDPAEMVRKTHEGSAIDQAPKNKIVKKVIQAQLANKDGIMKFKKPKTIINDRKMNSIEMGSCETETINNNNSKETKSKLKFVAPIKSQIPIKDIVYNINAIDKSNIEEHREMLLNVTNSEVIAVLIYSNGYCQLNNHHTDENCIPEGIMLSINDCFYYLKGTENIHSLAGLFRSNKIVCYEGKNLLMYIMSGYIFEKRCNFDIVDAKIGGGLIDPDNPPENFSALQKLLNFTPQYTIATECTLQKSAWYITLLIDCMAKLRSILMEDSLWNVFMNIEMRLLPIIADMERRGVCVDLNSLKSMETILLTKIKKIEQECYKAAGKVFQINSTLQVRTILYDELQLDSKYNIKIRETITKGAKSTSESMLRNLVSVHPLPKLILQYRHLYKAHSTFLTGVAQHVKDGVVKPTWVQTAAATGRIASNNPNLQAIPKAPFNLIMFPELEDNDNQQLSFRSVYTPRAGHTFLSADFKHVECRVFAHAAVDTGLLDALRSREDLFMVLAAKWLNKPESEISTEDRERTKRIVYASLYGAGTRKLMDILDVSYDQTLSIIASFNRTFPCLKSFGRAVVGRCARGGGRLTTLCGRGRRFKHIASGDFALKAHAERQAVNFIVQGSAADLCKMAMVTTEAQLRGANPPVGGHLVLQIHDELVWEVLDHDVERAAAIIKSTMEACGHRCGMALTLPVAVSKGRNWGEMEEFVPTSQ